MRIEVHVDNKVPLEMLQRAPEVFTQKLEEALERGAQAVVRQAKENLGERRGHGSLRNSVLASRVGPLHWAVKPGTRYALMIETGTGPAAGRPKYYPNPDNLRDWLTLTPSYRGHAWARSGSAKRGYQELDIWFRSRAMAWGIYQKGTKAYPFMQPAFETKRPEVVQLANTAMRVAVAQLNGGANRGLV